MVINDITETYQVIGVTSPSFKLHDENNLCIILEIHVSHLVKVGEEWRLLHTETIPESIDKKVFVNPLTLQRCLDVEQAIVEGLYPIPAVGYMLTRTCAELGVTSIDDKIYGAIANQVDTYVLANVPLFAGGRIQSGSM